MYSGDFVRGIEDDEFFYQISKGAKWANTD